MLSVELDISDPDETADMAGYHNAETKETKLNIGTCMGVVTIKGTKEQVGKLLDDLQECFKELTA